MAGFVPWKKERKWRRNNFMFMALFVFLSIMICIVLTFIVFESLNEIYALYNKYFGKKEVKGKSLWD